MFLCALKTGFSQNKIDELQEKLREVKSIEQRIQILDSLTKEMVRSNHPDQLKYLKEVVSLSKKEGQYDLAAEKSRFIIQKYSNKGQLDSVLLEIQNILKFKKNFKKISSEAHIVLKRGGYYYNREELDNAVIDYDRSGDLFLKNKDSIFAADARFFAGQVYFDLNDFINSVQRFEEAYNLYDALGDKDYANYTLNELSSLYGTNGFHDKAIYERKRILSNAKAIKNNVAIFNAYSHLFTSYFKKDEIDTAKKYLDSAQITLKKISDENMKSRLETYQLKTQIKYHLRKNELDSSYKYLKIFETQLQLKVKGLKHDKNAYLLYNGRYYKKKNKHSTAQKYYEELLAKENHIGDVDMFINANKEMSEVLAAQNKYNASYKYLKKYTDAKALEDARIKRNKFLYYQSQFETQRKDNEIFKNETEIALLEKDKSIAKAKQKTLWIVIVAILLLSTVISYLIWLKGKLKRKALAMKIEKNKKDLEEFTKQLIEKSKVQESLTQEIEKLKEEIGGKEVIYKIQDLTTTKILTSDDWYIFKEKFTKVHPRFFIKLKDKGYKLTKSEERLLAMEKLYLDTEQIATMLAISNDSVVRSRSRLRKKVNAPKGSSILEYLEAS